MKIRTNTVWWFWVVCVIIEIIFDCSNEPLDKGVVQLIVITLILFFILEVLENKGENEKNKG